MNLNHDSVRKIQGLVVFTVVVAVIGSNYEKLFGMAGVLLNMISPFLVGGAMAFVLNVPMRNIEKILPFKKGSRLRRPIALVLSILLVVAVLFTVTVVVVPELFRTLAVLQESIPVFFAEMQVELERLFADNPNLVAWIETIEFDWKQIAQEVMGFLSNGASSVLSTTFSAAASIFSGVASFFVGGVFAIYILLQKESLGRQCKKVLGAFLSESAKRQVIRVAALTEKTFSSFLTGQCLEAVILGSMFFVVLLLLDFPYALLIGVLIAFTALIPIFGAFIGCAVGTFLMLMVSPVQALIFVAIFLILQQIEGNLIYPHVVGSSVGLPSIWVLVAVSLGGSAMGVKGMLLFIPLCSVFYSLFRDLVNDRLKRKGEKANQGEDG